ncbi:MAG: efflux transporter outer membrane subunit [Muribaculaceae bacterium]|nr:efflux transporter outer membrane subunit [Muribaculaceae bacterium]
MRTLHIYRLLLLLSLLRPASAVCQDVAPRAVDDGQWWGLFADPTLDSLLVLARSGNNDVAVAALRIDQATQAIRQASAAYYPDITASASWQRARRDGTTGGMYSLGVQASWEIDVFGRNYSRVKESRYRRDVSRADYDAAMVSLCASVATAYFDLRTAQAQMAVAAAHAEAQDTIVSKAVARYEAGLASRLDVTQARTVLYSTRASVPALHTRIQADVQSLALLCGVEAAVIAPMLQARDGVQPEYRRIVASELPADMLRGRPDVVAAEASVNAAAAALGVARKDYLPTLSITGSIGTEGVKPGDLFGRGSGTWSVAPTLSWTVFNGMGRRAAVVSARDAMEEQIASYRQTVLNAGSEAANALTAYNDALRSIDLYKSVVEQSHESLLLSVDLYTQGLSPFSNVVDAQMNYLTYTNSLVDARGNALAALANLYRALGGAF